MSSIDPEVITHRLNIDPIRKRSAPDHKRVSSEEIQKLLNVKFVEGVHYPDWLANIVVLKKKNKK